MKRYWVLLVALATNMAGIDMALGQEAAATQPSHQTFAIETYVARTYNYLDNMVDKDAICGLPSCSFSGLSFIQSP